MGKLQNTFSKGIIDKDSQNRFVDSAELIDAENFFVTTIEGSGVGVGKNALGNALKTDYSIPGGKNVGNGVDSNLNIIYNIVKGTNHDYIIEYNINNGVSEIVLQSTTGTRLNLKEGERVLNVDVIYSGDAYNPITKEGGNLLVFSGDSNQPRIININRSKTWEIDGFTEDDILLIKAPPRFAPDLVLSTTSKTSETTTATNVFYNYSFYVYGADDSMYSIYWTETNGTNNSQSGYVGNGPPASIIAVEGSVYTEGNAYYEQGEMSSSGGVATTVITEDNNYIKNKFLSFSYRYKYKDGYYSSFSPWSEYAFEAKNFKLDYQTFENFGMENKYNLIKVFFNTGQAEVIGIDLLFKESNSSIVYIINKFIKLDKLWTDNSIQSFDFNNSKIYSILTKEQYTRSFDNVPLEVKSQTKIGNLIAFANYTEGRDLIDELGVKVVVDYKLSLVTTPIIDNIGTRSLHSNRGYEIGLLYLDKHGRKTTTLVCPKNLITIPSDYSNNKNTIAVDLTSKPPFWADRYKFVIKQVKKKYEIFYSNVVYSDGLFRWIKIDGGNRNKIKEGDVLTVKSDYSGVVDKVITTKILEIKNQDQDFVLGNLTPGASTLFIEEPGLYFKIKPDSVNFNVNGSSVLSFKGYEKTRDAIDVLTSPAFSKNQIKAGSRMNVRIHTWAYGSIEFDRVFEKEVIAVSDYSTVKVFFDTQIGILSEWTQFKNTQLSKAEFINNEGTQFKIKAHRNGTAVRDIMAEVDFTINYSGGSLIFETEPFEDLASVYFELPEVYTVTNGVHQLNTHILSKTFNCFSFGNGVESYQIKDAFNEKELSIDFSPTAVSTEEYKAVKRFADITYSGVYNSSSNVNKLNEFNVSTANFKDDIDKSYGPIYKIKGLESNLQVFQEDKDSFVYYGKDVLYNADGSSNITKTNNILGSQDVYKGEYGISTHPESVDLYADVVFHTDVKRGVVLKGANNGLFEISSQKMNSYFKALFRDNIITQVIGKYDQYHDVYILNIKYNTSDFVTWVYSDKQNGWLGRITFNPEGMCRVNSKFFSFKDGEIYEHNQKTKRNTFYGISYPSSFEFNFSQNPSERKNFKTVEMEATDAWDLTLRTDIDNGFAYKESFDKQEGVFRSYIRNSDNKIDSSLLSCQGIGVCALEGNVLTFSSKLENEISVGDDVRNLSLQLVGKIVSKTTNSLTLNAVEYIINGDFVMCSKSQTVENSTLLGYHMVVKAKLSKNTKTEVFAVNSEFVKSNT